MDIFYTSDTHSYVYPTDYVSREEKAAGYMVLSSSFPDDALKIDGGDVLQGSPLVRYEMKNGIHPLTAAKAFNAACLDVFVPGNHDFDFGYDVFRGFTESLNADVVCANLEDSRGMLKVRPYTVAEKGGLKIFITGAVTDYVGVWDKDKITGMKINDCVEALKAILKNNPDAADADFRICVYHGGFGNESGIIKENRADEIAQLGFDVLLTAHQHQVIRPYRINDKVLTLQAGSKASCFAHIILEKGKAPAAEIIYPEKRFSLSSRMLALRNSDRREEELDEFLDQKAGKVDGVLEDRSRVYSFIHGSSLADYINDLQLALTDADVSAASLFNAPVSLSSDITMRKILQVYPFSNTLVTADITGKQLKKAMERSASFVDYIDGQYVEASDFSPGKDERYNYDFYRGIAYTFDLSKPKGERVTRLIWKDTDLIENPDRKMRIVLNSYRASGTGGYDIYRDLENTKAISIDIQDALIASFEKGCVKVPCKTDFSVKI